LKFVGAEFGKHRIHFEDDGKLSLLGHRNEFLISADEPQNAVSGADSINWAIISAFAAARKILRRHEVCHKSHPFAACLGDGCRVQ
jgi:hypothetical protein